jgi:hypothetical protein
MFELCNLSRVTGRSVVWFPINAANVHYFKGRGEVLGIVLVCVFNSESVDDQSKGDGSSFVFPQSGSDVGGCMAMGFEELLEAVVGKFASLGQSVHAFSDFNWIMELMQSQDVVGQHVERNSRVLAALHGSTKIKIFEVGRDHFCIRRGEHAVDENLGGFGADVAGTVDLVATDGPAHTMRIFFLGAESGDHV